MTVFHILRGGERRQGSGMSLRCRFEPNQERKRGEVFVCFIAGRRIPSARTRREKKK